MATGAKRKVSETMITQEEIESNIEYAHEWRHSSEEEIVNEASWILMLAHTQALAKIASHLEAILTQLEYNKIGAQR